MPQQTVSGDYINQMREVLDVPVPIGGGGRAVPGSSLAFTMSWSPDRREHARRIIYGVFGSGLSQSVWITALPPGQL